MDGSLKDPRMPRSTGLLVAGYFHFIQKKNTKPVDFAPWSDSHGFYLQELR